MPRISVIMPAYNAEKYIKEAIDSILTQSFKDFELIIINDCSTDGTEDVILSYLDDRIVYLKNEKNAGVAKTLNRGLAVAQGEYIARMDSDDISLPQRLEKQLAYMQSHPNTVVCGSKVTVFFNNGEQWVCHYPTEDLQIRTALLFSSPFAHPSVMIRGNLLREHGLCYEEAFEKVEDYRLWFRLSQLGSFANLPEPLLRYRKHSNQVCATSSQEQYEGKLHLAVELLPQAGIVEVPEQRVIVDAFDGRVTEIEVFRIFAKLVNRMTRNAVVNLDKKHLRTLLKSRLIEIALAQGFSLPLSSIGVVGVKAWVYVNMQVKK